MMAALAGNPRPDHRGTDGHRQVLGYPEPRDSRGEINGRENQVQRDGDLRGQSCRPAMEQRQPGHRCAAPPRRRPVAVGKERRREPAARDGEIPLQQAGEAEYKRADTEYPGAEIEPGQPLQRGARS